MGTILNALLLILYGYYAYQLGVFRGLKKGKDILEDILDDMDKKVENILKENGIIVEEDENL